MCLLKNQAYEERKQLVGVSALAEALNMTPDRASSKGVLKSAIKTALSKVPNVQTVYARYLGVGQTVDDLADNIFAIYSHLDGKVTITKDSIIDKMGNRYPLLPSPLLPPATLSNKFSIVLNTLSRQFNIPVVVINDPSMKYAGRYASQEGKRVIIMNKAYVKKDTLFHEFLHPFISIMRAERATEYAEVARLLGKDLSDEEGIVQSLGELAARREMPTFLERVFSFVGSIIKSITGKSISLNKNTRLDEVLDAFFSSSASDFVQESRNIFQDQALTTIVDTLFNQKKAEGKVAGQKVDPATTKQKILTQNRTDLETEDGTDFYSKNNNETHLRLTALIGSSEHGVFSPRSSRFTESYAVKQIKKVYDRIGKDYSEDLMVGGKSYTFDELVKMEESKAEHNRLRGKIVHAYLEWYLTEKGPKKDAAHQKALDYANAFYGFTFSDITTIPFISTIHDDIKSVLARLNIKVEDLTTSEMTIANDVLGIGSTVDLLIVDKVTGNLKLIDIKTGNLLSDSLTSTMLKYGGAELGIADTKLNRAMLEQAFRAFMLKAEDQSLYFDRISVSMINPINGFVQNFEVDMGDMLHLIEKYVKHTNPAYHEALLQKGVFNSESYYSGVGEIANKLAVLASLNSYEDQVAYLERELRKLTLSSARGVQGSDSTRMKRAALADALTALTDPKTRPVSSEKNIGIIDAMVGKFKNLADLDHTSVKGFLRAAHRAEKVITERNMAIQKEESELMKEILRERKMMSADTLRSMSTGATGAAFGFGFVYWPIAKYIVDKALYYKFKMNEEEFWSFMWERKSDITGSGLFMNLSDKHPVTGRDLTTAEKNYRDTIVKNMKTAYKQVMSEVAYEIVSSSGKIKVVTKAEAMDMPKELPADFVPRIKEAPRNKKKSLLARLNPLTAAQNLIKNRLVTEDEVLTYRGGFPIETFEHSDSSVIQAEAHSFNIQNAYLQFMNSLFHKDAMDNLYVYGEGVLESIRREESSHNKEKIKALTSLFDDLFNMYVFNERGTGTFTTKSGTVQIKSNFMAKLTGLPKGDYKIDQQRLIQDARTGFAVTLLGMKLGSAAFNLAHITLVNISQSTVNAVGWVLSKIPFIGLSYRPQAGSASGVVKALLRVNRLMVKRMAGRESDEKGFVLAKKFGWLPDDHIFKLDKLHGSVTVKNPSRAESLLTFTEFTEHYGAYAHFLQLLEDFKVTNEKGETVSIYDAYDKDGNWIHGSRGKKVLTTTSGERITEELYGLDELEIANLKAINEQIAGSYRKIEAVAIERNFAGVFLVMFKKFFVKYLKVWFASKMTSGVRGEYIRREENGQVFNTWEEREVSGRIWLIARALGNVARAIMGGEQKEFTKGEQDELIRAVNVLIWFAMIWFAIGKYMDDDDKEHRSYTKFRLGKLREDMSLGIWPEDLINHIKNPMPVSGLAAGVFQGIVQTVFLEEYKTGERKGELKGPRTLGKYIPPFSMLQQIDMMIEGENKEWLIPIYHLYSVR